MRVNDPAGQTKPESPATDYLSVELLGEPLAVREGGGEVRVLSRICRHAPSEGER
jgi:hypothetical protein